MTDQESGTDQEHWRPPGWASESRTGLIVAGGALLIVFGLVVAAVVGSFGGPADDEVADGDVTEGLIVEFRGEGDVETETFDVSGRWEIRWEHYGSDTIEIEAHLEDGEQTVVTYEGTGGGSAYRTSTGQVSLRVMADDRWWIRVFEAPRDQ